MTVAESTHLGSPSRDRSETRIEGTDRAALQFSLSTSARTTRRQGNTLRRPKEGRTKAELARWQGDVGCGR